MKRRDFITLLGGASRRPMSEPDMRPVEQGSPPCRPSDPAGYRTASQSARPPITEEEIAAKEKDIKRLRVPPRSYSTLNGSRPVTLTRMSLHCQTSCQGRKRGGGVSLSSAAYATDALTIDSAATPAKILTVIGQTPQLARRAPGWSFGHPLQCAPRGER
jgi:hypothetical protein